jgi:hypothetical protein
MANALNRQELLLLARAAAEAKIVALQGQIDSIRRTFGIAVVGGKRKGNSSTRGASPSKGSPRKMSAAGRARIAAAAKARWAKWRKENGKGK